MSEGVSLCVCVCALELHFKGISFFFFFCRFSPLVLFLRAVSQSLDDIRCFVFFAPPCHIHSFPSHPHCFSTFFFVVSCYCHCCA